MILYHGTTAEAARKIMQYGFQYGKHNWKIKSKPGFVYLSLAYAPFYAMTAKSRSKKALIKVSVPLDKLYPDDDFVMYALGKPKYTQSDLNKINLENYKHWTRLSLQYMGNASAKFKDVKIIGAREFDDARLLYVCDPVITPINYKIMGEYYRELTQWIYKGKTPEGFRRFNALSGI